MNKSQYDILDAHRQRDMVAISSYMDLILNLFGEEIIWDKLHITDKNTQIYKLQQLVKEVKNVTVSSNREANKMINE